jgi:surface protein
MFFSATAFNQDISDWNTSSVSGMGGMFNNTNSLAGDNKGKIHAAFSANQNWLYDWRQYVVIDDSNFQTAVNLWFSNQADANGTYGHIRDWNTSAVTDMTEAFKDRATFNENIGNWDVSSVTTMAFIFHGSSAFNQPIGDWNVSSVTSLHGAFKNASSFNQPIGNWNVSSVRNLQGAFLGASAFNQAIGDWNVSSADTMQGSFLKASAFNQPIGNWNVSSVTSLRGTFNGASSFNQNIGDWNVSSARNMQSVFNGTSAFDQDLGDWNVSSATVMTDMFHNTSALSSSNKEKIHAAFSSNPNWPYDWSAQVPQPDPGDSNVTNTDNNGTQVLPGDSNATTPDANATQPGVPAVELFQPIVETGEAKKVSKDSATLRGSLVDNGGSAITERGFLLSAKPNPKPGRQNVTRLDANGSKNFQAKATNLKAGKKYYFRAFATNAQGTSLGSVETFTTIAGPRSPSWINAQPGSAANWWTSRWFGNFYLDANGWVRHEKLGWVFPMESPTAGLWLWNRDLGWLWTDKGIYPFLYDNSKGGWLYFYGQHQGTLLFYDYVAKGWITLQDGQ